MRRCMLVVILVGLFVCLGGVGLWAALTWEVETAAGGTTYFRASAMALGANGQPHCAYFDLDNDKLMYSTRVSGTWQSELVTDAPTYAPIGIAIDSAGRPHIAWKEKGGIGDLRYAVRNAASWAVDRVDSEGDIGEGCSIAIDGDNHPHIAYQDKTTPSVKYAEWTGTEWDISTVLTGSSGNTSLALDSAEHPHIVVVDGTTDYHRWNGSSWETETVHTQGYFTCKLVLDSTERPHAAFCAGAGQGARYAVRSDTGWVVEVVRPDKVDQFVTMALDSQEEPALVYDYYDGTYPQTLTYVTRSGTGWAHEPIDTFLENSYACLFFDASDYPKVGWYDGNPDDVMYAVGHPPFAVRWPR